MRTTKTRVNLRATASMAFVALLMAMCERRYSATQYALLSALAALGRVYVGPVAGEMAQVFGWPEFFFVTFLLSLPGIAMLMWQKVRIVAIDTAAALAAGEYLLTLDDDSSLPDTDALHTLVAAMDAHPDIGMAGGSNTVPAWATPFVQRVMRQVPLLASRWAAGGWPAEVTMYSPVVRSSARCTAVTKPSVISPRRR